MDGERCLRSSQPLQRLAPEPEYDAGPDAGPAIARARPVVEGESFTLRGLLVGLVIGMVICFSNMYFGLQTGWVSSSTMPASLMGFGLFKAFSRYLSFPFSPVENVLVQAVAGSMAVMPLGCGFVGVIPAMNYLLKPEENGPIFLSLWKMVIWSLGLCYFGVVFAVPLRRQVIIREKLKFPSGFSTAVLIGMLHGTTTRANVTGSGESVLANWASLAGDRRDNSPARRNEAGWTHERVSWKKNMHLLLLCFLVSGTFTISAYFVPVLRSLPVFGSIAANTWLWTLNPSLAYVGQGIIMGPETTLHMLVGAILGWGVLSPLARYRGWAPGAVGDWETGSKGWIIWTSLAIMLADAVVSLGYIGFRPVVRYALGKNLLGSNFMRANVQTFLYPRPREGYGTISTRENDHEPDDCGTVVLDAPSEQLVGNKTIAVGLLLSVAFCILATHLVFGQLMPLYASITAVFMALLLSIMGVRAQGETDLNPVSGISKLAQLFFALIIPQSNKSSVLINLVAGAVSEAGALQAGDLLQDLKTGHLLGAAPNAQFWGQVVGCTAGAVASAFIYRLYTAAYQVPGDLFQVPTSYVWIFTARLVTGKGLPPMAREWALGAAILFAVTTAMRTGAANKKWQALIPGGIAVAVGMYNVPSFTLARAIGGVSAWWWRHRGLSDTPLIVVASGFILGEGFLSIVNLIMQSAEVPHL